MKPLYRSFWSTLALGSLLLVAGQTNAETTAYGADDDALCRLHTVMPIEGQLRRTSLALRGHVPSIDEYESVAELDQVPAEMIDAMLDDDAHRLQMRRYHEQLMWPNPAGAPLVDVAFLLAESTIPGSSTKVINLVNGSNRAVFRGSTATMCQDVPQTTLEPGYVLGSAPYCEPVAGGNGECQEGWVEVHPYWHPNPEATVRVCAFAAQTAASYIDPVTNVTHACDNLALTSRTKGCGCGPSLQNCMTRELQDPVWTAMREQLLLLVDDHTTGERPYSQLLTTTRAHDSGTLQFFKKHLAPQAAVAATTYNTHQSADGPLWTDPVFHDDAFVEVERDEPHAGILTLPAYTLRFQTNRGRANQFRTVFMGQSFEPPSSYESEGCDPASDDLTQRCVCRGCHQVLEPLAAYFGPVAERGSGLLSGFQATWDKGSDCFASFNQTLCFAFYDIDYSEPSFPMRLNPLRFADEHPGYYDSFETGPRGLVAQALEPIDGLGYSLLARATVIHAFAFIHGREMDLEPSSPHHEIALLDELATELTDDDDLRELMRRLVGLDEFRRLP